MEEKKRVYPRRSRENAQRRDPPMMYGRRRPKRDFELSARNPGIRQ
jgi:hypothetical protein